MSDWAVGDLAVCVDDRVEPSYQTNAGLRIGAVYTVTGLISADAFGNMPFSTLYGRVAFGLLLSELRSPAPCGFHPDRFRKVLPDKHEACETEFVTLLQRIKRKQVA